VYEHRLEGVMAAQEAAKLAAKVKAEMAKERVQKTREEERLQRCVLGLRVYANVQACPDPMCDCSNNCHIYSGCRRHGRRNGCRGVLHLLRLVLLHVACTCNCFDTDC
jgi:hypothetical protein